MRTMLFCLLVLPASAAGAMTHVTTAPVSAGRASPTDPDVRLDRLAGSVAQDDHSHAKPSRSLRSILKDDPYLRGAYASLDNR